MEPWDVALKQWDANGDKLLTREECNNKDVLDRFFRIDLDQDQHLKPSRVGQVCESVRVGPQFGDGAANDRRRRGAAAGVAIREGNPYVPSPLVYRGVLYLIKERGILTSFDVNDGTC